LRAVLLNKAERSSCRLQKRTGYLAPPASGDYEPGGLSELPLPIVESLESVRTQRDSGGDVNDLEATGAEPSGPPRCQLPRVKTSSGRASIANTPLCTSTRDAAVAARASDGRTSLRNSLNWTAFTSSNSPSGVMMTGSDNRCMRLAASAEFASETYSEARKLVSA
jgi:hypothetical protein